MDAPIRNITDLRVEISRLKDVEREQAVALGKRFNGPGAILSSVVSMFSGSPAGEGKSVFDQDIAGLISRFVLPFTLNKTIFRNSNFIVKALVGLVSQKISHFITEDGIVGLWGKVTSLFNKVKHKPVPEHTTVPDFSETY